MLPPSLSNYFLRGGLSPGSGRIWARNYPAAPWTYRAWRNSNLLPPGVHSCAMKEAEEEREEEEERNRVGISLAPFSPFPFYVPLPRPLCLDTHVCRRIAVIALSPSWFSNNRGLNPDFNYVDSRKRCPCSRARAIIFRMALESSTPYRNPISFNRTVQSRDWTGHSFVKVKSNTLWMRAACREKRPTILHKETKREIDCELLRFSLYLK